MAGFDPSTEAPRRDRGGAYRGRPSTRVAVYKPYPPQPPARRPAEQPHSRSNPPRSCVALPVFVLAPARRSVPRRGGCSLLGFSILPGFSYPAGVLFLRAVLWCALVLSCVGLVPHFLVLPLPRPGACAFCTLAVMNWNPIGPVFRSISTRPATSSERALRPMILFGCFSRAGRILHLAARLPVLRIPSVLPAAMPNRRPSLRVGVFSRFSRMPI